MRRLFVVFVLLPIVTRFMCLVYGSGLIDRFDLRGKRRRLQGAAVPRELPQKLRAAKTIARFGQPVDRHIFGLRMKDIGKSSAPKTLGQLTLDRDTGFYEAVDGSLYSPRVIDWRTVI